MSNSAHRVSISRIDGLIRGSVAVLLGLIVVGGPLMFGAAEPWAYGTLQIIAALSSLLWVLTRPAASQIGWLAAAFALACIQVTSLPESASRIVAPVSNRAAAEAASLIDRPEASIAVNRGECLAAWRRTFCLAWLVFIAAGLAHIDSLRNLLIRSLALSGVVVLLLGLVFGKGSGGKALGFHDLRGDWKEYKNPLLSAFHSQGTGYADVVNVGEITYISNSPIAGQAMGALVNPNHFAAAIGLTCPLAIAVLGSFAAKAPRRRRTWQIAASIYFALCALAVAVPAQSRGGFVALLMGAAAFAGFFVRWNRKWVIASAGFSVLALGGVIFLANHTHLMRGWEGRMNAALIAKAMFFRSPWFGVGMGNYASAYPEFHPGATIAYFAHNSWIELAAETGLAGLLAAAVFIVVAIANAWRNRTSTGRSRSTVERAAIWSALAFAAAHAAIDFGVQVPANASICAVVLGLALGSARPSGSKGSGKRNSPLSLAGKIASRLLLGGCALWTTWRAVDEMSAARLVMPLRRAVARQVLEDQRLSPVGKRKEIELALPDAEQAFRCTPQNAEIAAELGKGYLHLSAGKTGPELETAELWFTRAVRLSPINPWTRKTLAEIREQNKTNRRTH